WTRLAQDFAHTALMRWVRIGVEEADRDGFHPFRVELREDVLHGLLIERLEHFAGSEDAFRHFERQVARDQWFGALEEEIEGFDAVRASDGVDIAKAPGGQERRARALVFQHGVDGDGRAVKDLVEPVRPAARKLEAG